MAVPIIAADVDAAKRAIPVVKCTASIDTGLEVDGATSSGEEHSVTTTTHGRTSASSVAHLLRGLLRRSAPKLSLLRSNKVTPDTTTSSRSHTSSRQKPQISVPTRSIDSSATYVSATSASHAHGSDQSTSTPPVGAQRGARTRASRADTYLDNNPVRACRCGSAASDSDSLGAIGNTRDNNTGASVGYSSMRVKVMTQPMDAKQAGRLLHADGREGAFLVRRSASREGVLALSFLALGRAYHARLGLLPSSSSTHSSAREGASTETDQAHEAPAQVLHGIDDAFVFLPSADVVSSRTTLTAPHAAAVAATVRSQAVAGFEFPEGTATTTTSVCEAAPAHHHQQQYCAQLHRDHRPLLLEDRGSMVAFPGEAPVIYFQPFRSSVGIRSAEAYEAFRVVTLLIPCKFTTAEGAVL